MEPFVYVIKHDEDRHQKYSTTQLLLTEQRAICCLNETKPAPWSGLIFFLQNLWMRSTRSSEWVFYF